MPTGWYFKEVILLYTLLWNPRNLLVVVSRGDVSQKADVPGCPGEHLVYSEYPEYQEISNHESDSLPVLRPSEKI